MCDGRALKGLANYSRTEQRALSLFGSLFPFLWFLLFVRCLLLLLLLLLSSCFLKSLCLSVCVPIGLPLP